MMMKIIGTLLLPVLFSGKWAAPEERRKSGNVRSTFSLVIALRVTQTSAAGCSREGLGWGAGRRT